MKKGETQLLRAVEEGQIAMTIASSDDAAVQRALTEAYESNSLRGKALLKARRLIEARRTRGKNGRAALATSNGAGGHDGEDVSSRQVVHTYQKEMLRQRALVTKAKACETRLLFIVSALRSLLVYEHLIALLRAEHLDEMPQYLAEQIKLNGRSARA